VALFSGAFAGLEGLRSSARMTQSRNECLQTLFVRRGNDRGVNSSFGMRSVGHFVCHGMPWLGFGQAATWAVLVSACGMDRLFSSSTCFWACGLTNQCCFRGVNACFKVWVVAVGWTGAGSSVHVGTSIVCWGLCHALQYISAVRALQSAADPTGRVLNGATRLPCVLCLH
jgi:hypothetical protein